MLILFMWWDQCFDSRSPFDTKLKHRRQRTPTMACRDGGTTSFLAVVHLHHIYIMPHCTHCAAFDATVGSWLKMYAGLDLIPRVHLKIVACRHGHSLGLAIVQWSAYNTQKTSARIKTKLRCLHILTQVYHRCFPITLPPCTLHAL